MYALFKKNPYLLQRYNVVSTLGLSLLIILAGFLRGGIMDVLPWLGVTLIFSHSSFRSVLFAFAVSAVLLVLQPEPLSIWKIVGLLVLGSYIGVWSNVLIHNASHNMIKPKLLNRFVGELAGLQVLSGFPGFAVLHMEHHVHSDDVELDPHPNLPGQSFWQYIDGTRSRLRKTFARMYQKSWGHDPQYVSSWKKVRFLLPLNRTLRAALLLLVLGPWGFTLGFITSHIVTQLAFAVINYYSHFRLPDGTVEIRNLDHNWTFRLLNRGFSGAFYHRNHHLNPKLFNPMKLRNRHV